MYVEIKEITLAVNNVYIGSNYPSNGFYKVHQKLKKGENRELFPDMLIFVTGFEMESPIMTWINNWDMVESMVEKSQPKTEQIVTEPMPNVLGKESIPYDNKVDTSKPTEVKFEGVSEDFVLNMLSIALHNNKTKE